MYTRLWLDETVEGNGTEVFIDEALSGDPMIRNAVRELGTCGSFRFIQLYHLDFREVTEVSENRLRMLDHWDNMGGSIERGYSGASFFFRKNEILINERTRDYARPLCSIGINGIVINNVNVKDAACGFTCKRCGLRKNLRQSADRYVRRNEYGR